MDSIQGRVLLGILVELQEEYTPRVVFQQQIELLVPQVWQTAFWEIWIKEEFMLPMWQGRTLHLKLQPSQKE
jgi:hypothetical protein